MDLRSERTRIKGERTNERTNEALVLERETTGVKRKGKKRKEEKKMAILCPRNRISVLGVNRLTIFCPGNQAENERRGREIIRRFSRKLSRPLFPGAYPALASPITVGVPSMPRCSVAADDEASTFARCIDDRVCAERHRNVSARGPARSVASLCRR